MIHFRRYFSGGRRLLSSALSEIQTWESYLDYCNKNNVDITSTTFKGTVYELVVKQFLTDTLKCTDLVRIGGSFDNGIDIMGKWNLNHFWNEVRDKKMVPLTSTRVQNSMVQPLLKKSIEYSDSARRYKRRVSNNKSLLSLHDDINILVQCKNHNSKIKAATIRELCGVYHHQVKTKRDSSRTFMFLVSPHPLTTQASRIIDSSTVPIIHCKLSLPSFKGIDIQSASYGSSVILDSVFMNAMSRALVKGLKLELAFEAYKNKS
ncbi:Piso0_000988 [Millerozyma farinosa CBS 7064]|uniref:Required for respiratory growth protein 7, mitochondrial n=1 Tax=Pichia sorbitophila (strain ATCC MYA-4447 / BCRC 22081 / CBS 7064 / NBRC 10061 / NRRL Y-12695) TaxID=559304 RepID=G8YQL8_PICSO|nr:Piso0_000988 [Millerozyma farinosa CBS 7064]CCE78953.1 Piso0_000988 [Millerozyma farinosa CBS 7064]